MNKIFFFIIPGAFFASLTGNAQGFDAWTKKLKDLNALSSISDTSERRIQAAAWFDELEHQHRIPYTAEDSVAFLYYGNARSVQWNGDFNGWGSVSAFINNGRRIPGTSIWILKASFAKDTRLDYKIVVNGTQWMLDPANELQQWSGVGGGSPNSQLCMQLWKEDGVLTHRDNIAHGKVREDILFNSKTLKYQITYSVYTPAGYEQEAGLPALYVTDGYEYMHPKMGNMITILDNLIADKKIKPIVVIFVDHREPVNRGNNKRMDELAMNPAYLDFFEKELIPLIESKYKVGTTSSDRGIMGCSMGGLNAAYFAFSRPGIFGRAGIQSPSFWIRPQIYTLCNNPQHPIKVSMTSGLLSDASDGTHRMQGILQNNACSYQYHEVNDSHSWGNWRNLIDDVLIDLFGS